MLKVLSSISFHLHFAQCSILPCICYIDRGIIEHLHIITEKIKLQRKKMSDVDIQSILEAKIDNLARSWNEARRRAMTGKQLDDKRERGQVWQARLLAVCLKQLSFSGWVLVFLPVVANRSYIPKAL